MSEEDAIYSVTLNTGGPRDPQYLLEVLEALAEAVRVANHLTLGRGALEYPSEADTAIRYLATAVSRLPQLLGQVGLWLGEEQLAGRIRVAAGEHESQPAAAVNAARNALDEAACLAERLQAALDDAARETSHMGTPEDTGGSGDG